jgi:5-oxoprolinase (ATP-hydrolysing)
VREHTLLVLGGAGGQHACAVARLSGMRRIVFHERGVQLAHAA